MPSPTPGLCFCIQFDYFSVLRASESLSLREREDTKPLLSLLFMPGLLLINCIPPNEFCVEIRPPALVLTFLEFIVD